jgi:hypothetical protein
MLDDKPRVDDLLKKIEQEPYLKCLTIEQLFFVLLDEKMVSFKDLSEAYVEHLEKKDNKNRCKLVEATTRLFQQFLPQMRNQPDVVNSSLYILNKVGNLVYGDLNEKYNYDESKGENDFENLYGFKL